jgi:hypothetical protein
MTNILLISEDYVKENSNLNDNVWGKLLLPAIREAQDIRLQSILGETFYNALLKKVDDGTIEDEECGAYKTLLDEWIQPFLMYQTICDLIPIIGSKICNLGVITSNDEYTQNVTEDERERVRIHYEQRADFYCRRMQNFILNNRDAFKEIDECDCQRLETNLHSSASTGLWLGGKRGRATL